ncbi:hypothetical protein [Knoellia sp. p5-6-4]|uniref:hypothetical protein n=1 Tax=unclassified Knoellia TaxID=2618719 RepID=UPI0023DBA9B2|nr:hypothetical protein [Knoellia sp. p5-6-4]MDF2144309.1 hypothetical protein [Knoellia sp. p5-6-4]
MSLEEIGLLSEQDRLRARARGDQHLSSVPLIGLAVLVAGGAPLAGSRGSGGVVYWLLATPTLFLALRWWHRRASRATGVGRPERGYGVGAVVVAAALLLVFPLLFLAPVAAASAVLLGLGLAQRNRYLAGWSLLLGVLGALTQLGFFDNRLYELNRWLGDYQAPRGGFFEGAPVLTHLALAALAAGAGLAALRRERG